MSGRTPCLDVEEKALRRAPFARVGADLGCGEDIAQENDVGSTPRDDSTCGAFSASAASRGIRSRMSTILLASRVRRDVRVPKARCDSESDDAASLI